MLASSPKRDNLKILLLEDDFLLQEILCEFLNDLGYEVIVCEDASNAQNLAYEKHFDLWIFDVKVPLGDEFSAVTKMPGFALLKALRDSDKTTPCIFITSLNSIDDIKDGFESGCDDFLKKPFELLELKFRIQTLLKREFSHKNEDFLDLGDGFSFDVFSKILYKNKQIISLTQKESQLLNLLLKHKNTFISQDFILNELWDYEQNPSELALRAYIKNLRKILNKDAIINQYSKGYCLCLPITKKS